MYKYWVVIIKKGAKEVIFENSYRQQYLEILYKILVVNFPFLQH